MKLNKEKSRELAAKWFTEDRQCYHNAFSVAMRLGKGAMYVEGYVARRDLPVLAFEHGWIEYEGEIIDPTPAFLTDTADSVYFPAKRYTIREVYQNVRKTRSLPVSGFVPLREIEFQRAYILAWRCLLGDRAEHYLAMHPWYKPTIVGSEG